MVGPPAIRPLTELELCETNKRTARGETKSMAHSLYLRQTVDLRGHANDLKWLCVFYE